MIHVRKVSPEYFEALHSGKTRFELMREEPDEERFAVGDYLALNEYSRGEHVATHYSGRCLLFEITYILRDHPMMLPDTAILGLALKPLSFNDIPGANKLIKT